MMFYSAEDEYLFKYLETIELNQSGSVKSSTNTILPSRIRPVLGCKYPRTPKLNSNSQLSLRDATPKIP